MGHAQLLRGGFFERYHFAAKNELLGYENAAQRIQQFIMEGGVLSFQVQHRDGCAPRLLTIRLS